MEIVFLALLKVISNLFIVEIKFLAISNSTISDGKLTPIGEDSEFGQFSNIVIIIMLQWPLLKSKILFYLVHLV
jgi:hypothetical protein